MKKFFVIVFSLLMLSGSAFAVTPSYNPETGEIILPSEVSMYENNSSRQNDLAEIQAAEAQYKALQEAAEETANIQLWEKLDKEMKLRRYDKLVFEMRKNFDEAKAATNPFIGEQGYVIYPYGEVIPIITCRPMRMTDIALEPGESITGIHAGDSVRWMFAPSQSMKNGLSVSHIVVKPSEPGISTNLLIHTDKRSYNLDFTATDSEQYIRGIAFSYQMNDLTSIFVKSQQNVSNKKPLEDELQHGIDGVDFDLILNAFNDEPDTKIYLYETEEKIGISYPDCISAHNASEADALISELADEFDRRSNEDGMNYQKIVLCVNGFLGFYRSISQESADILETLTRSGADFNMFVYIVSSIEDLAFMMTFRDSIKSFDNCMKKGNAIAIGGNLRDYSGFDENQDEKDINFAEYEGCLIHGGRITVLKFAKIGVRENG